MGSIVRFVGGVIPAGLVTIILFLVMYGLIQSDLKLKDKSETVKIEIGRQIQDTKLANNQQFERPKLDQPPPPPPAINNVDFKPQVDGVSAVTPDFDTKVDMATGFNPDRDAQPLVRIPPQYPDRCQGRTEPGVRKRVRVEFDVTPDGQTANPRVVSSDDTCLDRYATRAVLRWKYQPKVVNGEAQPRIGVQTTFIFLLEE